MNKEKILIIEDNQITSATLAQMLEVKGYEIVGEAMDRQEAITYLKNTEPDLVLVDINLSGKMGDINGIDLAKIISQEYDLPFIYITAYYDKDTITKAKDTSPAAYLTKPIKERDVYANIEMALSETNKCMLFKDGVYQKKVKLKDIVCTKSYGSLKKIISHGEKMLGSPRMSISELIQALNSERFVQANKTYIVNMDYITQVKNSEIQLTDKQEKVTKITLSELYRDDFKKKWKGYNKK